MAKPNTPEHVFISYSHDNELHKSMVLDFANRLREDGVDAIIDQYEESPELGWPRWMERQILDADFVVVVASKLYHDRLLGDEVDGVGLGAKWEGAILYQHLYESDMKTKGLIPAIFSTEDANFIPMPLRPFTRYQLDDEAGYEKIYRRITNHPKSQKPRLGPRRELPSPEVNSGGNMYVGGPIDPELWDKAKWRATFFITGDIEDTQFIPSIGLAFRDAEAAAQIFSRWSEKFGENDFDEELRISIVEGEIAGEEPGYTVHIGSDWDTLGKRLSKKSKLDDADALVAISGINRMNPPQGTENLERFKKAVRQFKVFHLVAGVLGHDDKIIESVSKIQIRKSRIYFRHVEDIGPNDADTIVLNTGSVDRGLAD